MEEGTKDLERRLDALAKRVDELEVALGALINMGLRKELFGEEEFLAQVERTRLKRDEGDKREKSR